MKPKKKISIKWGILLYFVIFNIIIVAVLWVFQIVLLNDFYRMIKTQELDRYADSVFRLETSELNEYLKLNESVSDTAAMVFDEENKLIALQEIDRFNFLYNINSVKIAELYNAALESNGKYIATYRFGDREPGAEGRNSSDSSASDLKTAAYLSDKNPFGIRPGDIPELKRGEPLSKYNSIDCILYCRVGSNASGDRIFLLLTSFIQPVDATAETLRFQLIIITFILIALSLIMAVIISRKISRPIIELNNSAKTLPSGEFKKHTSYAYKEINELGTTLECAAQEISKVDEFRKELIANVSHDLRTPLTLISGYSEVMRDIPGENTNENLQIVIDEAKRLNSLVTDMLDISKLESGMDKANMELISLTELVKSIMYRYKKLVDNDGYKVEFNYDGEAFVNADSTKISQVVYNLVNNAINYCGEDKTVIVNQKLKNGIVRLEVIDHGIGIDPEKLPYIWDKYYKADSSHKRASIGSGLGLSIVKKVLTLHNAEYGVESKPGEGSLFWFEMKTVDAENEKDQ